MSAPTTVATDKSSGRPAPPAQRRTLTGPIIVALAAGLAITLLQFWLNVAGAAIYPTPHEVPIAVIGSRPAVQQFAPQLQRGDEFTVKPASNDAAAILMVNDRTADGIVNLDTRLVQTAEAASVPAAAALQQLFSTHFGFRVFDIKPLQKHDPNGLGLLFLAIAFGLGGLPAGIILAFLSTRRRPMSMTDAGRWALLVVVYGVVLSLAVAAVAFPLLGYGGSHFLTIWGWGALLTGAAMATGLALVALFGLPGVPLGLLVILLFGVPSSPVPVQPWNFAPSAYRVLGPYDPVGAAVDGMRNGLYFGGASPVRNLLVLLGWIVVPLMALLALGWRSERLSLAPVEPVATTLVGARVTREKAPDRADAYLVGAPGYHDSVPAVLKNAIDGVLVPFAFMPKPIGDTMADPLPRDYRGHIIACANSNGTCRILLLERVTP